jgi:2-C-methyl-D-erythritol 2,4-cyclodiphosphate synthase
VRVGFGYDSHRLVAGRALVLGGVVIPFEKGLLGHSDADVLLHSLGDAILGAMAAGDLGTHFPDTDAQWKGASSMDLLERIREMMTARGFTLNNVDCSIVLEEPRLKNHIPLMVRNIERLFSMKPARVSIKAKTNEKMGFVGRAEGIAAYCVVTLAAKEATHE